MTDKQNEALDLYLRGYKGDYLKDKTGISTHSLLKTLAHIGQKFTKADIVAYQTEYVTKHHSKQEIIDAYKQMSLNFADLESASHRREIITLGCCFGSYAKVFKNILGDDAYKQLRNECWKEKQNATVRERYGVDNVFEKSVVHDFVSDEAFAQSREHRRETMLDRYGVEEPNQNEDIKAKMLTTLRKTNEERYGVTNAMQVPDIALKSAEHRQAVMLEKYGAPNSVQVDVIRDKIFAQRAINTTLNSSLSEDTLFVMLCDYFGEDDVLRNVKIDSRYPYHVDFYITSRDMFIELNGDKCHGGHWYDAMNKDDQAVVSTWIDNMNRIESNTGKKSRYRKYVQTWTVSDVAKREIARANDLNYVVFWDSKCMFRDGVRVARLQDAHEWFEKGCPDSKDWE